MFNKQHRILLMAMKIQVGIDVFRPIGSVIPRCTQSARMRGLVILQMKINGVDTHGKKKEKSNNVAVFKTYLHIFLYYVGIRLVWKCNRLDRGFVLMALFPRILLNFKSYYVGLVNCTKAGKDSKENFLILSSAWCPPVELHKNYFF